MVLWIWSYFCLSRSSTALTVRGSLRDGFDFGFTPRAEQSEREMNLEILLRNFIYFLF